jgi:hypothetical protein
LISDHLLLVTAFIGDLVHNLVDISLDLEAQCCLNLLVKAMLMTESSSQLLRMVFLSSHYDDAFSREVVAEVDCYSDDFLLFL